MFPFLLILAIKLGLFLSSRALLPWLFGQARHASLESRPSPPASLPQPAHASSAFTHTDSLHDDDDSPFTTIATSRHKPNPLAQIKNAVLAPVRIRNSQSKLDLAGLAAILFSLSLEESATLFVVVLLEAAGLDGARGSALRYAWNLSILAVLGLAIVFIPLGICLLLTYRSNSKTPVARRVAYLCIPFIPWLVLFFKLPLPSALSSPDSSWSLMDVFLARTAVIGVTFIALLSGSAALSSAWDAGESLRGNSMRPPSASDVRMAQESFQRACTELNGKKTEIERLENQVELERQAGTANRGWSIGGLWNGDPRSREIKTLKSEVFGLSAVAAAMRDDLDHLRALQRKTQLSHTLGGRILNAVGWVWAVYCAFRILLSTLNLLIIGYHATAPPDVISYALASLIRLFSADIDLSALTRQVSLLFTGLLIWARIGSVLSHLANIFRAASAAVSTSFLVLFLAHITTIYLLATLIQLRTSLPPASSATLLSSLPHFQTVFGALFDSAFLIAAAATAAIRYAIYAQRSELGDGGVLFSRMGST